MTFKKNKYGIVINTDDSYLKSLKSERETKQKIETMQQSIDDFKEELTEIKNLLLKVLNG